MGTKESYIALVLLTSLYLRTWHGFWLKRALLLSRRFMVLVAAPMTVIPLTISGEIN